MVDALIIIFAGLVFGLVLILALIYVLFFSRVYSGFAYLFGLVLTIVFLACGSVLTPIVSVRPSGTYSIATNVTTVVGGETLTLPATFVTTKYEPTEYGGTFYSLMLFYGVITALLVFLHASSVWLRRMLR